MEDSGMKKILIRRLGVASVARFVGVIQAIWAFIAGFFVMFGGIATVVNEKDWNSFEKFGASIAVVVFSLVVIPFVAFLVGWLYGAIISLIANLFLHTSNGIELDIEEEK